MSGTAARIPQRKLDTKAPVQRRPRRFTSSDAALRRRIVTRYQQTCQHCGLVGSAYRDHYGFTWEIDHVVPRSRGGSDAEANLVLSCRRCNLRKGSARPGTDWQVRPERRWRVRPDGHGAAMALLHDFATRPDTPTRIPLSFFTLKLGIPFFYAVGLMKEGNVPSPQDRLGYTLTLEEAGRFLEAMRAPWERLLDEAAPTQRDTGAPDPESEHVP